MNRRSIAYCLLILTGTACCPPAGAQESAVPLPAERVGVCSDRTLYVAGEKVRFSARVFQEQQPFVDPLSRILYCELITQDGLRITGGKFLLTEGVAHGSLPIPGGTVSGYYYLKCYTRFMRNQPAGQYTFLPLKVVNPVKEEVLEGEQNREPAFPAEDPRGWRTGSPPPALEVERSACHPGEEIGVTVGRGSGTGTPSVLVLSVIPACTAGDPFFPSQDDADTSGGGYHVPETRGISLSGRLVTRETRQPIPGARINLSVLGDKNIQALRTDPAGRFWFALPPLEGKRDLFLSAFCEQEVSPELLIDNDFCSRPVNLPAFRFTLSEPERRAALQLAVNLRVASAFETETLPDDTTCKTDDKPFYGEPSDVLVPDRYIELPALEDYFRELPWLVKVRKAKGRKQLRFFSDQEEISLFDPLVLVDWVAVNDLEKILAIPPREVDRIEVVNAPYVKGPITYGGILSIVSKRNDFAGIDLPASGLFLNYAFLESSRDEIQAGAAPIAFPDTRNTVAWFPDIPTTKEGTATLRFTAPATPGRYMILLQEIGPGGITWATTPIYVDRQ